MSLTSGFFDSVNEDRKYNTLQLSSIFDGIISDGVYATYGDHFMVSPVSGMQIKVGAGRAWLDHTWTLNDTDYPLTVEEAEVVLKRIDTVIIEVDRSNNGRINRVRIVKGTPASSPAAPTLTKTSTVKQYPLADILVQPNATAITTADITNRIGTSALPWVTGIIDHISADELITQWRAEFNTLLDTLETMISQAGQGAVIDNSVGASALITSGNNAVLPSTIGAIPDENNAIKTHHIENEAITGLKIASKTVAKDNLADDIPYTKFGLTADRVRKTTISTSGPSGGSDGDIHIQYTA